MRPLDQGDSFRNDIGCATIGVSALFSAMLALWLLIGGA